MVIGHEQNLSNPSKGSGNPWGVSLKAAPSLDRIAAAIVDFTIVFSLAKIFAARAIFALKVSFNFSLDQALLASLFNILWLSFSVFLIYKVLTYRTLGRTIGQALFGLQIVNAKTKLSVDQYTLVLRSFLSFIGVFLLFPLVSVIFNDDGRTFYDKICETLVVTKKTNVSRVNFYLPIDKLVGSSLILIVFMFLSFSSLWLTKNTFKFKADFVKNSKVCSVLTDYHKAWSESKIEESRLEVALALYSAGELSVECLAKEIDFDFTINPSSANAYFAKGLLSFESDASVIRYFKKTCQLEPESSACRVATWVSLWPNSFEGEETPQKLSEAPMFLRVWDIKRNHQKGNLLKLAESLEDLKVPKGLEGFFAEHLMRVELIQGDSQRFSNILKLAENKNNRSRKLTEAFCGAIISKSCESYESHKVCKNLPIDRSTDRHLQNMHYACKGSHKRIFASDVLQENFYKQIAQNEPVALDNLKSIFLNSDNGFGIRFATLNFFFQNANNLEYLISFKTDWEQSAGKDFVWRLAGEMLKDKFNAIGDMQKGFEVFKHLASEYDELKLSPRLLDSSLKRVPAQSISDSKAKKTGH